MGKKQVSDSTTDCVQAEMPQGKMKFRGIKSAGK